MANIINFSTFWQRTKQNKSVFCRNTSSVLKQRVRVQAVLYHWLKNPTSRAEWRKYNVFSWLVEESDESLTLAAQHRNTPRLNVTYLRAFRRPSTLSAGWSFRTFMQPFIWGEKKTDCEWERSFTKQNKTDPQWRCFHMCAAVWECVCVCGAHVYLRGLVEGAVGMDVVIENDDSDHDPHAEQERVLAAETTRILPKTTDRRRVKGEEKKWGLKWGSIRTNYIFLGFLLSEYMWVWMSSVVSKSQGLLYCLTKGHMMLLGFLPLLCCVVKHVKGLHSEKAQSYFLPQKTVLLCLKHLVCSRAFASVT